MISQDVAALRLRESPVIPVNDGESPGYFYRANQDR
jgi:hypothetical protein